MDSAAAKNQYAEAKRLFRVGRHAEALGLLQTLDADVPNVTHVLLAQAECLAALGDAAAARVICDRVLAQGEDPRARRILARCGLTPPSAGPGAPLADDFAVIETPAEAKRSSWPALTAIGGVIAAVIAVGVYTNRGEPDPNAPGLRREVPAATAALQEPADPVAEHARALEERKRMREAAAREAQAALLAEKEAASKRPGYVVPEEEWDLYPETGVPAWRPGVYRQLPIPGSWFEPWNGPRTLDVYIPLAYAERPEELFPTLSITMPQVNPGFLGLEPWAERRGVILIVINSSTNDFHPGGNTQAQIDAMNFLPGRLRAHPALNFAAGTSGGARMALRAASRWPEVFAGVLMTAHSGDDLPLDPRLRVGIIHGHEDFNAPYVPPDAARLRAQGIEVRVQVIRGGHITAPAAEQAKMLDWMLDAARRDLEAGGAGVGDTGGDADAILTEP